MMKIWNSAVGLLIVTGTLLGLTLPFGKVAGEAGVPPVIWAMLISVGAGTVLYLAMLARKERLGLNAGHLRYYAISAAISYAIPNMITLSAMPHLGAGYMGIMYTLSPMFTLILSVIFGVRKPNALGMAGIVVGFLGALLVATTRGEAGFPASLTWVGIGILLPIFLAAGNIYRSWDWPKGAGTTELAVGSHLAAGIMLLVVAVMTGNLPALAMLAEVPALSIAQILSSAGMFVFFFRLQVVGGPVYLSQISYVAAAIAIISGTLLLGESYVFLTWFGAVIILAGVVLTTKAQTS
ncbi:DMT family transporter [Aquamicrobium zhengzhouense]|uniref:DMT family transporter n=1 Tax=Aquamicrobium zhengzhouense TaxID=2781738 RepID=A0ABS0SE69_9HYPH|nr:DMT family transporter [Aquamicrobium zhengzhouense]MBI1621541.1 DMT family transporter [Aquamicrobium zhengzhouense]